MALTVVLERKERVGSLKLYTFKVTDSDGSGGTVELSSYLNHIFWADAHDITTAVYVSALWTDGDETVTIGSEATAADVLKLIVIGS